MSKWTDSTDSSHWAGTDKVTGTPVLSFVGRTNESGISQQKKKRKHQLVNTILALVVTTSFRRESRIRLDQS